MTTSPASRLATTFAAVICLVLGPMGAVPAEAAEPGSISGTVVDSTTELPVPAASVLVRPAADDNATPVTVDAVDGAFTVSGLPAGTYTVELRDVSGEHVSEFYQDVRDIADATPVTVTAGQDVALDEIGLDPGASLAGVVQSIRVPPPGESDRVPVPEATVLALPVVGGQVEQRNDFETTTDGDGEYSIANLPSGTYRLKVSADGYFDGVSADTTVTVGEDVDVPPIQVDKVAGIVGRVEDAAGTGLGDIVVDAFSVVNGAASASSAAQAVSGVGGTFELRPLRAGQYRLRFRDGSGTYQERFDTLMTIEGGETGADADVIALSPVVAVVPPAPYSPPAVARRSASVKVGAKGGRKKVALTITVRASGVTPTGRVTIRLGGRTLKTVTLKRGTARVTLTKQKKGKRAYTISYAGDPNVRGRTVTTKKVRIR